MIGSVKATTTLTNTEIPVARKVVSPVQGKLCADEGALVQRGRHLRLGGKPARAELIKSGFPAPARGRRRIGLVDAGRTRAEELINGNAFTDSSRPVKAVENPEMIPSIRFSPWRTAKIPHTRRQAEQHLRDYHHGKVRNFHGEALSLLKEADCPIQAENRVLIPPALVEWALCRAPSGIAL